MQQKSSRATIIFSLFCAGGILALLSQTGITENSTRDSRQGNLNPGTTPASTLESDLSGRMIDGPQVLDAEPAPAQEKRCCRKGPLFD